MTRQWRRHPLLVLVIVGGLVLCGGGGYLWGTQNHDQARVASARGEYAYTAPAGWNHWSPCRPPWERQVDDLSCAAPQGQTDYAVLVVSTAIDANDDQSVTAWATDTAEQIPDFDLCGVSPSAAGRVRSVVVCLVGRYSDEAQGSLRVKARGSTAVLEYCLRTEQPGMRDGCDYIWNHLDITG